MNYLDKVQYLYPGIQHVMLWHTQKDGTPWADPYDGLVWNNKDIKKPTKKELDAIKDEDVENSELAAKREAVIKECLGDLCIKSNYKNYLLVKKLTEQSYSFRQYIIDNLL